MNEILKKFPPSSINNSREIVRSKLERFKRYPSDKFKLEIEHLIGIDGDWSDKDYGEIKNNK